MKRILLMVALLGGIMFAPVVAGATVDHCPDHNAGGDIVKTEVGDEDGQVSQEDANTEVPALGTLICVKASTGNTGQVVADGEDTLQEILFDNGIIDGSGEQGRDVSYWVVYPPVDEPEILEAFICFEGEIITLTDEDQTSLNLKVSVFLELNVGAIQVLSSDAECEVPVATTTTTTAPPVVTTTTAPPVTTTTTPDSPVRTAAPVSVTPAPAAAPAPAETLPHTGLGNWLWIAGVALLLTGVMFSLVGRRSAA